MGQDKCKIEGQIETFSSARAKYDREDISILISRIAVKLHLAYERRQKSGENCAQLDVREECLFQFGCSCKWQFGAQH